MEFKAAFNFAYEAAIHPLSANQPLLSLPCITHTPSRAGPAEFKAAFDFAYEAAGRLPEESSSSSGGGGLFGGLSKLFGGAGAGVAAAGTKRRPLEADLRALKNLNNMLLRLGAVYEDAETRAVKG